MKKINLIGLGSLVATASMTHAEAPSSPNIILIMADDMGFSDIGCYGSEIQTPNLDRLAQEGLRYSQFYNAARCCPTRASLLTGVYPHEAGMGWMDNSDVRTPAYRGDLGKDVRTIAEVMHTAGYATYMSGKWHVSDCRKNWGDVRDNWPMQRGFDQFYGIIGGAAHYFHPNACLGNEPVEHPQGKLFTETISERAAGFIQSHEQQSPDQPFFLYLAYTAPHWPLHAHKETIAKYKGFYNGGWDSIRETRFKKQKAIGLWNTDFDLSPRDSDAENWDQLSDEKKSEFARRMEIYAAQVDEMDQGIGQVLSAVEAAGQTDNTLIFFLSDNGACAEFNSQGKSKDLFGNLADTWESYRLSWANASSTPFREYKHWIHEGGIRTPLIVHWPRGVDPKLDGSFVRQPGHLVDIMATCIDVSGANYPQTGVKPLRGTSLQAHFSGGDNGRGPIFWEHEANMGMRDGSWKLVAKTPANEPFSEERLELYNMDDDPSELNNLAARYPERVKQMYAAWTAWGNEAGIFPLDSRDWGKRQRAMRRDANSEFDYNLGSWRLINRRDLVRFSVDHSGKLSGPNSARIEVLQTGERPADALMALVFPPEEKRPFHLSFQAAANRQTDLIVRIENHGKPAVKIANHTFSIGPDAQTFEIDTSAVEMKGDYQLAFYFGTNPAGDQIWIDAINLKPE